MKKFRYTARIAMLMALSIPPIAANSASVICEGTVTALAYHAPGVLYVRLSSMNVNVGICSTDTSWGPTGSQAGITTPSACKAIYANLLVAKQAGTVVRNMYLDGDTVPPTCTTFPAWSKVNVRFFEI